MKYLQTLNKTLVILLSRIYVYVRFVSHSFAHQCICVVVLHRQFVAIYGPLSAIVRLR